MGNLIFGKWKLGWKPQFPDHRDVKYSVGEPVVLPPVIDLRDKMPPVYDQLSLGSCTGNAAAGAFEYELIKQGLSDFVPSRLFIYYNERLIEGTILSDSGAQVRDAIKVLNQYGVCDEKEWPYDINKFTNKPDLSYYSDAQKNKVSSYLSLDNTNVIQLKQCLVEGFPFIFGFSVYESFESEEVAKTGIMPVPTKDEQFLGGHCIAAVGYKTINNIEYFIIRNSWGVSFGDAGYFYMPTEVISNPNLASDFWTIRVVS